MTTQLAFAFGVLVMVAIIMMITIVIGMVKVIKLEKQFKNLENAVEQQVESISRHSDDIERNIYGDIHEIRRNYDQVIDRLQRELMAYTDSRIDKSLGSKEKQLLKS